MKESRGKKKLRRWGRVLIVFAILALVICIVKAKAGGTDADQVLTIADQGFEGHYYDAGEREKTSRMNQSSRWKTSMDRSCLFLPKPILSGRQRNRPPTLRVI